MALTERIPLMVSPEFKRWLEKRAATLGISISDLLRRGAEMYDPALDENETTLNQLLDMMEESTKEANEALDQALAAIHETSADLAQTDARREQFVKELSAEMDEPRLAALRTHLLQPWKE